MNGCCRTATQSWTQVDEKRKESKEILRIAVEKRLGINPALSCVDGLDGKWGSPFSPGLANMQELAKTQAIRRQPAAYEVNLRQKVMSGEPGRLILIYLTVCEYYDTSKLTVVLQNVGVWIGMLLFSVSFYYGLAHLLMWAGVAVRFLSK
jgi:hypothetical protein